MFSLQTRKIIRDIWQHRMRTFLVVLTIAICVFSVGALGRVWLILSTNLTNTYLDANPASASISVSWRFDDSLVKRVARLPEVEYVEGRNEAWGRIQVAPNRWRLLQLIVRSEYETMNIDKITSENGQWPPEDNAILLERASLPALPFQVGDMVTVEFGNRESQELRLAGSVHDVTQISSAFSLVIYGYVTQETLEELTGKRDFAILDFTVTENRFDEDHIEGVVDTVTRIAETNGQIVTQKDIPTPGKHELDNIMQSVLLILAVLSVLALFLGVFLIINIVSAQLTQQTQQIGAIKAVGGISRQIIRMYIRMVIFYGGLALIATLPLAIGFSYITSIFFAELINFEIINFQVPRQYYFVEIFVSIAVPCLAALLPILKAARLTVRESIGYSSGQNVQFGVSRFERLLSEIPNLPTTILYPFRNIFRQKVRLVFASIALCIAGAIWISVTSVQASFEITVDEISDYWQEDIKVNLRGAQDFRKIEALVMQLANVELAEPRLTGRAFRVMPDGSESIEIIELVGLEPVSPFIQPQIIEGRWLRPDDTNAIVINIDLLSIEPDIKVGDKIDFRVGRQETSWQVVGITTSQVIGGADMFMSPIGYVNHFQLSRILRLPGMVDSVLISTGGKNIDQIITDIEILLKERNIGISSVLPHSDVRKALDDAFRILLVLLQITSLVFGFVGGLGLTSMMTLNVLERTKEIGIIRSVGGERKQLSQIIVIEGIFVGIMSWIFAVIIAYPMGIALGNAVGITLLRTSLTQAFPIAGPLTWLGIVILLSIIASLIPGRNAAKLTVRETISFE